MPFRDTWATCEKCGKQFVFTVEEQRRLAEMGFEVEPSLCPDCQSEKSLTEKLTSGSQRGAVKWYDSEKRYGFITLRDGEDIFFHRNDIAAGEKPSFSDGTPVSFRVEKGAKGPKAVDVKRVETGE